MAVDWADSAEWSCNMKYRRFGKTDWKVSEVGLGCWQIGGADWGEVSDAAAFEVLNAALDTGVNFLDTADVYGLGRSEELIGRFLKTRSDSVLVATKLGRFPDPGWPANFEYETIFKHVEASLKRLGRDHIDLIQLHCVPTEVLRRGEVFDSLRRFKETGQIKHFGVSVESMEEAAICLKQEGLASLQIIFNLFRQKPVKALFDQALAKQVGLIVRLPLASGLLSGKFTLETQFAETDHRNYNRNGEQFNVGETFAGIEFEKAIGLVEKVREIVPEGIHLADAALRWCLDHPAVSVIIPGAKRAAQVKQNTAVSEREPLPDSVHQSLKDFYQAEVSGLIRGPY